MFKELMVLLITYKNSEGEIHLKKETSEWLMDMLMKLAISEELSKKYEGDKNEIS